MSLQFSEGVRNAMLNSIEATIGTAAIIRIRSGAPPADCGTADSGDELAKFELNSDWMAAASSGSKALNDTPLSTMATGTGDAGHYRIYASDGTTCHEQGTVTVTGGGGDMTVDNVSINTGQTVRVTAMTKTAPGA